MKHMRFVFLLLTLLATSIVQAQIKDKDYTVDSNGNVCITCVLENLSPNANDIYAAARHYIQNSYKHVKYKITTDNDAAGTIIGEGEYMAFHEGSYFPYSYFLNAPVMLRVDAKEGRARIILTLSYYTGKRMNGNDTAPVHDLISQHYPINESETAHRKLYGKAFPALFEKAKKTLEEIKTALLNTHTSDVDNNW